MLKTLLALIAALCVAAAISAAIRYWPRPTDGVANVSQEQLRRAAQPLAPQAPVQGKEGGMEDLRARMFGGQAPATDAAK